MHHFTYRRGAGGGSASCMPRMSSLADIADAVGTPFYCYSTATLERHYRVFADAFAGADAEVCYSVKANSNLGVLATLARLGAGMDVVSEGELRRALAVGVAPDSIAFSGVGKTKDEMAFALKQGILAFNVESEPELRLLSETATALGKTARIALRVNPDIDARTHHKIATGKAENKFGVPFGEALALYRLARDFPASIRAACICISAARSPTLRRSAMLSRCSRSWSRRFAARRLRHRLRQSRRRPRRAVPHRRTGAAAP